MKTQITEKQKIHEQWYKEAKEMTMEKLPEFLRKLTEDYGHDYGTICHALAAGAIATMWAMDRTPQGGITGFQAGCIMWSFIRYWEFENNECGLKIIDYDDLLFPQNEEKFDKTIDKEQWHIIQEQAKEKLKDKNGAHPNVIAHWESIILGQIPFGFKIKED